MRNIRLHLTWQGLEYQRYTDAGRFWVGEFGKITQADRDNPANWSTGRHCNLAGSIRWNAPMVAWFAVIKMVWNKVTL